MPLTVAAPNAKRAAGTGAFADQPRITTGVLTLLRVAVPSYRVPVHVAITDPTAPLAGMHPSVRFTCCSVTVPLTCTTGGKPQLSSARTAPDASVHTG